MNACVTITPLEWDSTFFGLRTSRAVLDNVELDDVLGAARREGVDCLLVVVPGADPVRIERCIEAGGGLTDIRVELERTAPPKKSSETTRLAGSPDLSELEDLSERLSASSRFRRDARFDPSKVTEMYRIWVRRCLSEGVVIVPKGAVTGLVGARVVEGEALIDLVFTTTEVRRKGIAATLAEDAVAALATDRARVVTQVANVAAQRVYQSMGFKTARIDARLHFWFRT